MKKTKRIFAILLSLAMILSMTIAMSVTAFADTETAKDNGNFSITITNNDQETGHKYVAYQIFKGDLVEKESATTTGTGANLILSNIEWGDGVNGADLLDALKSTTNSNLVKDGNSIFKDCTNAAQVAKVLDKWADDSDKAQAFAEIVQDHLGSTKTEGNATKVEGLKAGYYYVQDEGTFDTDKSGAKTRYILQVVHSVEITQKASVPTVTKQTKNKNDSTNTETEWQNVADYDIGDAVPFKITGTLPSTFAEFDTYKTYTMTDTLSGGLDAPAADDITIKVGSTDVKSHFDVSVSGQTITISLKSGEDLKTWTAPALTAASEFVVEYSAVLNSNAVKGGDGNNNQVTLTFSNNPNADGDGDTDTTPPSTVVVFTYNLTANKVDGDNNNAALTGAHFALYKNYGAAANVPTGKTAVTTAAYDGGRQTYTFGSGSWALVQEITTGSEFSFDGIDDGSYVLVETVTPDGYNSIAPYAFEVTTALDNTGKAITSINGVTNTGTVDLGGMQATVNKSAGTITSNVVNNKGAQLPSTGGIGTVIFYVLGSALLIGCAIVLISRRRMQKDN